MGNQGSTPLHKAANDKDLAKLRWEVQQHPSAVNAQEQSMGWTPLHVAAFKGSDPIVRELLARGSRHDITDKEGRTALHLAAMQGFTEVVRDLMRRGASTALKDKTGASPYDYAVQKHPGVAALLGRPPPPAQQQQSQGMSYTGMPPVDLTAGASAHQLLPAPPTKVAPVSTGAGENSLPRVNHDRTPVDVLLPAPPTLRVASYPAGPNPAEVYGIPGYGAGAPSAPPPYPQPYLAPPQAATQQHPQPQPYGTAGHLPYPTVPGRQQQHPPSPQQQPAGPTWGGVGGRAPVQSPYPQPPPQPAPQLAPQIPSVPPIPPVPQGSGSGGGGGSGGGLQRSPAARAADLDWGPSVPTDWGDEADLPSPPIRRTGVNPIMSARFQLEKLFGAGLAQLGIGGGSGGAGGGGDVRHHATSGASVASAGSSLMSAASTIVGGRIYGYDELRAATGGFSPVNKLGEGGYGPVYRGSLDGIPVAVKVMDTSEGCMQGRPEFEAEVNILSSLHHPHVVLLIGSCPEKGMLVYELMTNSSLEVHLFGGARGAAATATGRPAVSLAWRDRVRIAAEVASALLFLHSAPTPIVHMDLKPDNVLLDEHLTAKLGDVGLARLAPTLSSPAGPAAAAFGGGRSTVQDSRLVGTYEYMDPEYLRNGEYSSRSDVYALGMVMLQLLTGTEGAQVVSVVETARKQPLGFGPCIDPRAGPWPEAEAVAFADLALRCVEYRRQDRPDLRTVILPTLMQLKQRTLLYEQQPAPSPAQQQPDAVPPMFLCPITQDIMDEPVVAADGYTYERLAIQEWVARSQTSPLTNMRLEHTNLVDNRTLRSAIKEWRERQQHRQQLPQEQIPTAPPMPPPMRPSAPPGAPYDSGGW